MGIQSAIWTLRAVAWLALIAGVLVGILLVAQTASGFGLLAAFVAGLQGAIVWAVLMALSHIAVNVIVIRRNTEMSIRPRSGGPLAPGDVAIAKRWIHLGATSAVAPNERVSILDIHDGRPVIEKDGLEVAVDASALERIPDA